MDKDTIRQAKALAKLLLTHCAKDPTRFHLCGAYWEANTRKLIATDGHRMAIVTLEEYPWPMPTESGLIGREMLQALAKAPELVTAIPTEQVHFPPWRQVVPTGGGSPAWTGFDPAYLGDLALLGKLMASYGYSTRGIRLDTYHDTSSKKATTDDGQNLMPVTWTATWPEGEAIIVLMPMRM